MADWRSPERLQGAGVFDEDRLSGGIAKGGDEISSRVARVKRGGNGTVGHNAEIREIEFEAGFRIQGNDGAFPDAETAEAGGNLFSRAAVLFPGKGEIAAAGGRLPQGRRIAVSFCRLHENLIESSLRHPLQF